MISHLRGTVAGIGKNSLVIEINGVGYLVYVPPKLIASQKGINKEILLFTHLVVKEDSIVLYGFKEMEERDLFLVLTSVSRIGPQIAMNVLGTLSKEELIRAILTDNEKILTRVSGIGPKQAKRMILELKDKLGDFPLTEKVHESGKTDDAVLALISLGFEENTARDAVNFVKREGEENTEEIVKAALRRLKLQ